MFLKHWSEDQDIPSTTPLIVKLLERYKGQKPLSGFTFLLIQHQLGNQVLMTKALIELGVKPNQLYWLDIPYTAISEVREHIERELKIPRKNFFINRYQVLDAYAPYQRERTQRIIRKFFKKPPEKLIVLDDGAYFIEAMATFNGRLPHIAIVEQTTRGIIKINNNAAFRHCALEFPIINVAQSKPKKKLESPFIAYIIFKKLQQKLEKRYYKCNCLLLGYGTIGKQVAALLRNTVIHEDHLFVFDISIEAIKKAKKHKFKIWQRDTNAKFNLVIGCSGTTSFGIGDYFFLEDHALLISGSSGSAELSREDFIELADSHLYDDIILLKDELDQKNIYSDLHFKILNKHVTFMNGGFPINFDGRVNCVPTHYIQPTIAIMVEAAVQAATATKKGMHEFNDPDGWITKEFRKLLGTEKKFLDSKKAFL
jgi:S-adenosylhomocysteine hydrolase